MSLNSYWRLFAPATVSALASAWCPFSRVTNSSYGTELAARPPAIVFRVVWPILYFILGYTWHQLRSRSSQIDWIYGATSLLLGLWLVINNCQRDQISAFYVICLLLGGAIALQIYVSNLDTNMGLLLTPYVTWLILATFLSSMIISQ